jgi:hypothetical protein
MFIRRATDGYKSVCVQKFLLSAISPQVVLVSVFIEADAEVIPNISSQVVWFPFYLKELQT